MQDEASRNLIKENVGALPNFGMGGTTTDRRRTAPVWASQLRKARGRGNTSDPVAHRRATGKNMARATCGWGRDTGGMVNKTPTDVGESLAVARDPEAIGSSGGGIHPAVPPVLQGAEARHVYAKLQPTLERDGLGELLHVLQPAARGRRAPCRRARPTSARRPDRRVHLPVPAAGRARAATTTAVHRRRRRAAERRSVSGGGICTPSPRGRDRGARRRLRERPRPPSSPRGRRAPCAPSTRGE